MKVSNILFNREKVQIVFRTLFFTSLSIKLRLPFFPSFLSGRTVFSFVYLYCKLSLFYVTFSEHFERGNRRKQNIEISMYFPSIMFSVQIVNFLERRFRILEFKMYFPCI